jgi:glutathione S-transferase
MKLYYKSGACSLASHILLNEIDADFSLEKVDTEQGLTETGADFAPISPNGYVPALSIPTGDVITENPAVLQYLGDLAPDSGLTPPAGTLARTRLHEILNFLSSELHAAYGPFFSGNELSTSERKAAKAQVTKRAEYIESRLEGSSYLLGAQFSVADAYAFVILNWSNFVDIDLAPWSNIQAYMDRIQNRPAVQKSMFTEDLIETEAA